MPFPLTSALRGTVLVVGGVYVDIINLVEAFPEEDTACRSLSTTKTRGGNAANTAVVLSQLFRGTSNTQTQSEASVGGESISAARCTGSHALAVEWLGLVPSVSHLDSAFALAALNAEGVQTARAEEAGGEAGQPTAYILVSAANGSRTIVSTRNGLRELSPTHFARTIAEKPEHTCWCHLECREMPAVLHMARAFAKHRTADSPSSPALLSVEIEKPSMKPSGLLPLLALCDVVFLSREFLETHADEISRGAADGDEALAIRLMRAFASLAQLSSGVWICAWGAHGAYALDVSNGTAYFQAAVKHEEKRVVDTVGAGDTFIAATTYALALGANVAQALSCACCVAGEKVTHQGFSSESLAAAVPRDMPWMQ